MAGFAYGLDDGGAIPDEHGKRATFEKDIRAGRGPADTEQYGRPQYTDEVNESAGLDTSAPTPSPPISTSNFDQGAIPVDESAGLNTGAPPAAAPVDESAGLNTGAPQQQGSGSYGPLAGADFNPSHVPGNAKRIIQYLMGADAAPPPAADKFKQGVQTEHPGVSEDDANLIAVHKAGEAGGPEAAWSMVQYNRSSYNAKQAFAKAALAGAQGKPPDIQAAASAATQASHHVLDGSQAVFIANPSGVTATVKMPGTRSRVSYNLTPQQFSQYLDVGGNGQWDKLMEQGGIPAALQKIAGARPAAQGAGAGQPEAGQQTAQADEDKGTQAPAKPAAPNGQFDPDLEARADRMFGKGKVYDPGRIQWMSEQESQQENRQNKLDVEGKKADAWKEVAQRRAGGQVDAAHERRLGTENAAATRSEGYAKAQQQKAQLALQKMAAQSRDSNERNRINVATRLINNPNWATQSADERNAILKNYGLDQLMEPAAPRTQAPTTPQAAAPQQQQQQNAPARLKLPDGKYYIKGPDGKAMLDPNQ